MNIFVAVICFVLLLIEWKKTPKLYFSPIILFYGLWGIITFLSGLGLYGLNQPSLLAYLLILTMVLCFSLGTHIAKHWPKKKNKIMPEKTSISKNTKQPRQIIWWLYYVCCFIALGIAIYDCIMFFIQASQGTPLWQIRNWLLEPYGSENPILSQRTFIGQIIRVFICAPIGSIAPAVAAYSLFFTPKTNTKISTIAISVALLIFSAIGGGGSRLGFIWFFINFFLASWLYYHQNKDRAKAFFKKYRKLIMGFIILCIGGVLLFTITRTGIHNIFKQAYLYFALPPTILSTWLPTILASVPTYGLLTTLGLHSYAFRGLDTIGLGTLVPDIYNTAHQYMLNAEKFINVGAGNFNAFVTPIYYFMLDGGIFFTIFASILFGWLISYFFNKISNSHSLYTFVMYVLVIYGVFISFMRVQTVIPSYIFAFLMVFLLFSPFLQRKSNRLKAK